MERNMSLSVLNGGIVPACIPLKGMSFFWDIWGKELWNKDTLKELMEEWQATVVRLPIGSHKDNPGYLSDNGKDVALGRAKRMIDAAIELGLYVIVDIHNHKAIDHKEKSINFMFEIAEIYGDHSHIMYEVINEPVDYTWDEIKAYAEEAINTIRAAAPNAICMVGLPEWGSKLEVVHESPLSLENIMYTYHFYAGSHKEKDRNRLEKALKENIPIFVSECGVSEASGNGKADYDEFDNWLDLLKKYRVGWCGWAISKVDETSSTHKAPQDHIQDEYLTDTGFYYRDRIRQYAHGEEPTDRTLIPYNMSVPKREDLKYRALHDTMAFPKALIDKAILNVIYDASAEECMMAEIWLRTNIRRLNRDMVRAIIEGTQIIMDDLDPVISKEKYWTVRRIHETLEGIFNRLTKEA